MRKHMVMRIALPLLALVVAGCGGPPVEMRIYSADRFSMSFPKSWERDDEEDGDSTFVIFAEEDLDLYSDEAELIAAPKYAFALAYHVPDEWADYTPDDLEELIEDDLGFKAVSVSDITIDGEAGRTAEVQGEIDDEEVFLLIALVHYDGFVMHFAGVSPGDEWAANRRVFDYMLSSIEFVRD